MTSVSSRGNCKGIVLAGGEGTRLSPVTRAVSKQLLPVYNKPMIYYPLSVLMLAGIREILVITSPRDVPPMQSLLGDGSQWGVSISYAEQPRPEGLAQAFIIGREFIGDSSVSLVLGDNIFYGHGLHDLVRRAAQHEKGGLIFGYWVENPEQYGVVEFDKDGHVVGIEEKPLHYRTNYAIPGLYFYDKSVVDIAMSLRPSKRGELEITDINKKYLERGELKVEVLGRGLAWLDMGTHESLLEASLFIETIEKRQGLKVACLEEVAFMLGYIGVAQIEALAAPLVQTEYGKYLMNIARRESPGNMVI